MPRLVAVADCFALSLTLSATSASPHEITLVEQAFRSRFVEVRPKRLIGDQPYETDLLTAGLRARA